MTPRVLYYHGEDQPATDLTPGQLKSALADPGGVVWLDFTGSPLEQVTETVHGLTGIDTRTISPQAAQPGLIGLGGEHMSVDVPVLDATLAGRHHLRVLVGPNFLVTLAPRKAGFVDQMWERLRSDARPLDEGSKALAAALLEQAAGQLVQASHSAAGRLDSVDSGARDVDMASVRQLQARLSTLAMADDSVDVARMLVDAWADQLGIQHPRARTRLNEASQQLAAAQARSRHVLERASLGLRATQLRLLERQTRLLQALAVMLAILGPLAIALGLYHDQIVDELGLVADMELPLVLAVLAVALLPVLAALLRR